MDDGKDLARYDNANGLHWCNLSDVLTCLISDTFSNKNGKNWLSFATFTFSYDFCWCYNSSSFVEKNFTQMTFFNFIKVF